MKIREIFDIKLFDIIKEEIDNIIQEEYNDEDYYYSYEELATKIMQDFLYNNNKDFTKNIYWSVVPFQLLKSTWEDWVKLNGMIRYPKNLEKIENLLYRGIMRLDVINSMCGHSESGEHYMDEKNEYLNEVVDNYLLWKTQKPIDVNQLQIDYTKGGGYGNPTPNTNYYVSQKEQNLFNFLNWVYNENDLQDYSLEIAKENLIKTLLDRFYDYYSVDPKIGQNYVSDYGLQPLKKLLIELMNEQNPSRKIPILDKILNVAHQRSDLAGWLVQGGSNSLYELSGFGELSPEESY